MVGSISEPDWNVFRQLHPIAVERFCGRVLAEAERIIAAPPTSLHERYRSLHDLMRRRDREMAKALDDLRRSTALMQIGIIQSMGLWTEDEMAGFSDQVRAYLALVSAEGD